MLPVDLIMHEYLHKNLENIKKTRKNFICYMRPLSIVRPPPPAPLPPALE